jgi:hypothetical protein
MKQQFYTPSGYQTVESPENKPYTFVAIAQNGEIWSPISFTTTEEWSDSYINWERRVIKKVGDSAKYAVYRVFRYEDTDMLFAELTAAVARLADIEGDDVKRNKLALIRRLTNRYHDAMERERLNREAEEANVVNA